MFEGVILFALSLALLPLIFIGALMITTFVGLWYLFVVVVKNIEKRLHGMAKKG